MWDMSHAAHCCYPHRRTERESMDGSGPLPFITEESVGGHEKMLGGVLRETQERDPKSIDGTDDAGVQRTIN